MLCFGPLYSLHRLWGYSQARSDEKGILISICYAENAVSRGSSCIVRTRMSHSCIFSPSFDNVPDHSCCQRSVIFQRSIIANRLKQKSIRPIASYHRMTSALCVQFQVIVDCVFQVVRKSHHLFPIFSAIERQHPIVIHPDKRRNPERANIGTSQ